MAIIKLTELLSQSIKVYPRMLAATFLLWLLVALIFNIAVYLDQFIKFPFMEWSLKISVIFLEIYVCSIIFWIMNARLKNESLPLALAFRQIFFKLPKIYSVIFVVGFIFFGLIFFSFSMIRATDSILKADNLHLLLVLVAMIVSNVILVLCFFAWPLAILDSTSIPTTLVTSIRLVSYHHWFQTFFAYILVFIVIFALLPNTQHGQWLQKNHLNMVFNVIFLLVAGPIVVSFILMLLKACQCESL